MEEQKKIIDLSKIFKLLWSKKKSFFIVWIVTFILSCIWIFPQPRYYQAEVSLAPETTGEDVGGLAGIASSFGINMGGAGTDAIYPTLYPDNPLTQPFRVLSNSIKKAFSKAENGKPITAKELNPFKLSEKDSKIFERATRNITCAVDKKTEVISITVIDQDPLVCATMADSVCRHLQDFIIMYRTKKARIDADHYQHLADSAKMEYESAVNEYSIFCDANQDIVLQSVNSKRDALEQDMQFKYNTYSTLAAQLEAMKIKLQERTPVFTTLKSASVPIKPAGPKRVLFVIGMLMLVTFINSIRIVNKNT